MQTLLDFELETDMNPAPQPEIRLSQKAPWNPRLGNPYRNRWAEHDGLKFKVSADFIGTIWWVEIVDHDGNSDGNIWLVHGLAAARTKIVTIAAERH
jgi:hypothetical protein